MSFQEPTFRRFVFFQHKGAVGAAGGVQAYGVQFPSGKVAVCEDNADCPVWTFASIEDARSFYATDREPIVSFVDREPVGVDQ